MSESGAMSPVFEDGIRLALCTKNCGCWGKKGSGMASDPTILCAHGEDVREVLPRAFCLPWVDMLVDANAKFEQIVKGLTDKAHGMEVEIVRLERLVLDTKGSLSRTRAKWLAQTEELGKVKGELTVAKEDKDDMWQKLKAVQAFMKERAKYDKKLAVAEDAANQLPDMEERIFYLERQKEALEKKLEAEGKKNNALTARVLELERERESRQELVNAMDGVVASRMARKLESEQRGLTAIVGDDEEDAGERREE